MFRRIYRADFICSKYVLNLLITLFIVQSAASFIESDIFGRFENTTASLRLTRQKVLIQAVPNSQYSGTPKLTRGKKDIDNRNEYSPPDIIVEEFRIRAKINFPARPRTCKDLLSDYANRSKFGIGFSRSENQRILYCQTEAMMKNNQSIVDTKKSFKRSSKTIENLRILRKIFSPETTKNYTNIKNSLDSKNHQSWIKKLLRQRMKNEKIKKDFFTYLLEKSKTPRNIMERKIGRETKAQKFENDSRYKFKITDHQSSTEGKILSTRFSPSFEDYEISEKINNELISDTKKKIDKRSIKNLENIQPCHRKVAENVTDYMTALKYEKSNVENLPFANFSNKNEIFPENKNVSSTPNFSPQLEKIRIRRSAKAANNSTSNENHKKVSKKSNKKKKTKSETTTKKSSGDTSKTSQKKSQNSTKKKTKLSKRSNNTIENSTTPPNFFPFNSFLSIFQPFLEGIKELSKIPGMKSKAADYVKANNITFNEEDKFTKNVSTINLINKYQDILNSTENRFLNSPEISNSTRDHKKNISANEIEINSTNVPKIFSYFNNSLLTSLINASNVPPEIFHETNPDFRISNENTPIDVVRNWMGGNDGKMNLNSTNSQTDLRLKEVVKDIFETFQSNDSKPVKMTNKTWNSDRKDNDAKLLRIEMSTSANIGKNATLSTEATTEKSEDYRERATLNFTIIDTNCTEPVLLNSQPTNSINNTANMTDAMSQISSYPKLRRYSRNDTVDKSANDKRKLTGGLYNEAKNRYSKNSLNDSTIPSSSRKGFSNRGRKRSRYKGKMQQIFTGGSQSRVGKQSWRHRNGPIVTNSSIPSISSTLPTDFIDSHDSTGNGTLNVSPSTGESPELSTVTNWQEIKMTGSSKLNETVDTLPYNSQTSVSDYTEVFNEIRDITTQAGYGIAEIREQKVSTFEPVTKMNSNFQYSSPSNESSIRLNHVLMKISNEPSTSSYDKTNDVEISILKKSDNSSALVDPTDSVKKGKNDETHKTDVIETIKLPKENKDIKKYIEKIEKPEDTKIFEEIKKNEIIQISQTPEYGSFDYSSFLINELDKKYRDKKITINSTPETEFLDTTDRKMKKFDSTKSTTELYIRKKTDEEKKIVKNATNSTIIDTPSNSVTSIDTTEKSSSINSGNTINTDFTIISSTVKPETMMEVISSKPKTAVDAPILETIEKRNVSSISLPRSARRARDTRNLHEYDEPQDPELDYDIDSLGDPEIFTEATRNIGEDNKEVAKSQVYSFQDNTRGSSTAENFPYTVALPHSAVHGVFFNEEKTNENTESTGIPGIQQIRDHQLQSLSTIRSSNSVKKTRNYPHNLTNFIDEPEFVDFVKSLEDFLFDDSATGTFDRKPSLQDLDAESSNRNFETRSAIFKTKKLSLVDKKKTKNSNNWGKTKKVQSVKSATKKKSVKQNKPTIVNTKIGKTKMEKEKIKNNKMKASSKGKIKNS